MLANPLLKQGEIIGIGKYRLGKSVPHTRSDGDKRIPMPIYAIARQLHTKIVRGRCLASITGSREGRRNDGPKFMRTMAKVYSIEHGERGHTATKRERIKGVSQTSIVNKP